jgi:tetratricopeptide (TPR) repeat protein
MIEEVKNWNSILKKKKQSKNLWLNKWDFSEKINNILENNEFEKGLIFEKQNEFEKAEKYFENAFNKEPTNVNIFFHLINTYIKNSKLDTALNLSHQIAQLNPDNKFIFYKIWDIFILKWDINNAISIFSNILEKDNEDIYALSSLW